MIGRKYRLDTKFKWIKMDRYTFKMFIEFNMKTCDGHHIVVLSTENRETKDN